MKKYLKSLILLPMLVLASCGTNGGDDVYDPWGEDGDIDVDLPEIPSGGGNSGTSTVTPPVNTPDEDENSKHVTYLALGANGLYKGKKGANVPDLNLENTITYHGDAGRVLPGKDKVTSSVSGVEFVSWISYEDEGKPTIYDKVPAEDNKILYAFFAKPGEGNVPGGNPDQGGGDAGGDTDETGSTMIYVNDTTWENIYIHAWKDGSSDPNDKLSSWNDSPKMNKNGTTFSYNLPKKFNRVIFASTLKDGSPRTGTLTVDHSSDKLCYHVNHGEWGKLDDEFVTKTIDLYFKNEPEGWTKGNIHVHAWNDKGASTTWPGLKMNKNAQGYYTIALDTIYTKIKFNDGFEIGAKETGEITDWQNQKGKFYNGYTNKWEAM